MRTLLALALALAAAGADAEDECEPTTSTPDLTLRSGAYPEVYVDVDGCGPACVSAVWLYEETNGIPGLQRSDEMHDDTCGGKIERDSAPFLHDL